MKHDTGQMTLKNRLSVTAATIGIALVSTLVGAQADGTRETAAPPSPVLTQKSPVLAENTTNNNYPPADFDPEKKSSDVQKGADSKQQPKAQHKWPNASQGAAQSKEYPPQIGIDLTPPAKPPVAKPELKYPKFPKVSWPKDDKGNPIYPPFHVEKTAPAAKLDNKTPVAKASEKAAPATAQQVTPAAPAASAAPAAPAVQWAPPPQPWGQPVMQAPGQAQGTGNADQAWQEARKKAEVEYKTWQVEQEKIFKARQAALKKQWEAQQVELKRAREAHVAEMKRREDEARRIQSEREKAWASEDAAIKKKIAEMDKQAEARRKAMEAEMFRQRQAMEAQISKQREAMKAEMEIMNQRNQFAPVPPLPPKLSPPANAKPQREYATPEQVAPKQYVPQARPARPFRGPAPQGNWGYQPNPQWQYQNRMPPPWGYNPYWQGANRPWPQAPYPYGRGYNQPR